MVLNNCSLVLTHCPHQRALPRPHPSPRQHVYALLSHSYYVLLLLCIAILTCVMGSAISLQPPPPPTPTPTLHFRHIATLKFATMHCHPDFYVSTVSPQSTVLNHRPRKHTHTHTHQPTCAHLHDCIPTFRSRDVNCHPALNHSPTQKPTPTPVLTHTHTHAHAHTRTRAHPCLWFKIPICIVAQPQNSTHVRQ